MQKVVMILSCVVHLSRACGDCTRAHEGKLTGGKLGNHGILTLLLDCSVRRYAAL